MYQEAMLFLITFKIKRIYGATSKGSDEANLMITQDLREDSRNLISSLNDGSCVVSNEGEKGTNL